MTGRGDKLHFQGGAVGGHAVSFSWEEREMLLQRSTSQVNSSPLSWYQKEGGNEHGLSVLLQVLKEDGIRRWEQG